MASKKAKIKFNRSAKIRQLLKAKMEVSKIAAKVGVEPSYVYQIRWMDQQKKLKKGAASAGHSSLDGNGNGHLPEVNGGEDRVVDHLEPAQTSMGNGQSNMVREMFRQEIRGIIEQQLGGLI